MAGGTSVNKRRREMQRKERQADKVSRRDERKVKKDGPDDGGGRKVSLEVFLETWDGISPLPEGWNDPVPEEETPDEEVAAAEAAAPAELPAPVEAARE